MKLLPDLPPQPFPGTPIPRTLVLDLDETLIYSSYSRSTGWRVAKRPGAEAFLAYLCNFYEIVVFSSKLNMYVDPIVSQLDPNGYISHRLFRSETKFDKGTFVKDLSVLNRDLSRVIVIDHDMKNTLKYHPENGIEVPRWNGDPNDTTLLDLVPFLESLSKEDVSDVREHLEILKTRGIADGVRAHKEMAPARLEALQEKQNQQGYFFGAASAPQIPPPPPPPLENDEESVRKNARLFSSKLFRPETKLEVPEEAAGLKKDF